MLPPRAYIFIGLNVVRALSIIALLLVFASSIDTMVTDIEAVNNFIAEGKSGNGTTTDAAYTDCEYVEGSTVPNEPAGAFWAVLNHLLIIAQVIVLLFSEIGWPLAFFDRYFPVLGSNFGLGALGLIQCLLGAAILSHHVDEFSLVSAFFLFSIGCLNILLGLIFRASVKSKRSIFSWRERAKDVIPTRVAGIDVGSVASHAQTFVSSAFATSSKSLDAHDYNPRAGYGFGRQGEKAAGLKGFMISKPIESLPRYANKPTSIASTSRSASPAPH